MSYIFCKLSLTPSRHSICSQSQSQTTHHLPCSNLIQIYRASKQNHQLQGANEVSYGRCANSQFKNLNIKWLNGRSWILISTVVNKVNYQKSFSLYFNFTFTSVFLLLFYFIFSFLSILKYTGYKQHSYKQPTTCLAQT